jgi:hypothetical protein
VLADPTFLDPAGELLLYWAETMHLRNDVERHEANIVPMKRISRSRISKASPDLHVALPLPADLSKQKRRTGFPARRPDD